MRGDVRRAQHFGSCSLGWTSSPIVLCSGSSRLRGAGGGQRRVQGSFVRQRGGPLAGACGTPLQWGARPRPPGLLLFWAPLLRPARHDAPVARHRFFSALGRCSEVSLLEAGKRGVGGYGGRRAAAAEALSEGSRASGGGWVRGARQGPAPFPRGSFRRARGLEHWAPEWWRGRGGVSWAGHYSNSGWAEPLRVSLHGPDRPRQCYLGSVGGCRIGLERLSSKLRRGQAGQSWCLDMHGEGS